MRKVKQRRRRKSRENPPEGNSPTHDVAGGNYDVAPARISYVSDACVEAASSERSRRHSKPQRDESSPKYKQYGFIDSPEAVCARDQPQLTPDAAQKPQSASSAHGSRGNSAERSRHGSKSRETSRERRESSRDRQRRRSKSRERHTGTGNCVDNAAYVNGDVSGSRRPSGGKERSDPGDVTSQNNAERRRKRRSTGDKTFPEQRQGQGHPQGHRHSATLPSLNGYLHDNDAVSLDNHPADDDVFIPYPSNEGAVLQTKHVTSSGAGTRASHAGSRARSNRRSVPGYHDNRTVHVDR